MAFFLSNANTEQSRLSFLIRKDKKDVRALDALTSFLLSPIWLSKLGLDVMLLAFAPSVIWLFAGKILGGTIGGSYTAAVAYVADMSSSEKRSRDFAFMNSAAGLGTDGVC